MRLIVSLPHRQYIYRNKAGAHRFTAYLLIKLVFLCSTLLGQWSTDPTVNTIINDNEGSQFKSLVTSDGDGGAIIMWVEKTVDLYAQRIDRYGQLRWAATGVPICNADNYQFPVGIAPDGYGGAYFLWRDYRGVEDPVNFDLTKSALYLQAIDRNGTVRWQDNGIELRPVLGYNYTTYDETIIPDGQHGVYIVYQQAEGRIIRLRRVDSEGNMLFGPEGKIIRTPGIYEYGNLHLVLGNSAKVFVVVVNIYVYLVAPTGEMLWTEPVKLVTHGFGSQATTDGQGGVIHAGMSHPPEGDYLNFQRINEQGQKLWGDITLTPPDGIVSHASTLQLIEDGNSGAFVTWLNDENGVRETAFQHLDSSGNFLMYNDTIPYLYISHSSSEIVPDGQGNIIYSKSLVTETSKNYTLRKIDGLGNHLWGELGVKYQSGVDWPQGFDNPLQRIHDGHGGAIMVWEQRTGPTNSLAIVGAYVNRDGVLGGAVMVIEDNMNSPIPKTYKLYQNYPNPFNISTNIKFSLPQTDSVTLIIYDIQGTEVERIITGRRSAGEHTVIWDGKTGAGRPASSGVYICQIKTQTSKSFIKMLLLK